MEAIKDLLGLDAEKLQWYQMCSRAFVVFFLGLAFVRIAGIRTLGRQNAFDVLTSLMLGAIMGRAVVSEQPFFSSMLSVVVIMLLHRLVAWVTFHSQKLGRVVKGDKVLLIKNGKKQQENLNSTLITDDDIHEAMRHDVQIESMEKVKEVYLERSGEVSIVKKEE